jgi:hypothetical protein
MPLYCNNLLLSISIYHLDRRPFGQCTFAFFFYMAL